MKLWITANGGDPYISPQDDVQRDGDNQEECCDEKVGKKTFTKTQFREPMRILSTALHELRAKLSKRDDISPLLDKVLTGYNVIAEMTTHGTLFDILDQDTDDNDRSNNDGRRSDDTCDNSSRSSDLSKNDASNGSDEDDNSTSNNEVPQDESNGNDGAAQEKGVAETDDSGKASSDKLIHIGNQADICPDSEFNLDSIDACFKSLHGDEMTCGVISGKNIQALLGLEKIPNLKSANHKKYFYSIRSDKMKKITQLYKKENDASKINNSKQKLIKELVACLFDLKSNDWHNSIDALPAGTTRMDEDVLLLWKQNTQFVELFMTQGDPTSTSTSQRRSPRKSAPTRDEKQTNEKLDLD